MKRVVFLGILFLAMTTYAGAAEGPILHHDLRIVLDPAAGRLEGTDTLSLPSGDPPVLLLAPQAEIHEVSVRGKGIPYRFKGGRLTFGGAHGPLTIRYSARFSDPVPTEPLNTEDPSFGVAAAITPKGTFLGGGAAWFPDTREGKATFRLRVEAPAGTSAVTSGRLVESHTEGGRTVSIWEITTPVQGLALAAGPYRTEEGMAGKIPVYTYFYPESEKFSATYREAVIRYIDLYTELFGPYPFPKFAVAENFFPTGYGYPSWTLLGSTVVRLPFIVETSLGHEVAHSWWGNGVWVDYRRGNWSEGLTTYVADYLYKERESPEEAREYRLKILRDYASLVSPGKEIPLKSFLSRRSAAEQAIGYGKAAMVFHMTRQKIGDEPFWRGLRTMVDHHLFQQASWDDFARVLGATGKTDLASFFSEWIERPGAPILSLEGVKERQTPRGWTVTGNIRQARPYYDLNLPIRLETRGKPIEIIVRSRAEGETSFTISSIDRPRRLLVDPDAHVFRRLASSEIPATVNGIRGSGSLLVVASKNLPDDVLQQARTVLVAMGKERTPVVSETKVSPRDLKKRDVLFLGLPASDLLPPLPADLRIGGKDVVLKGKSYRGKETAFFAALPHPSDPGRVVALFLPGSAEAAAQAARKIPHYGKYSYLAFVQGNNVDKGIWPVTDSPLIHTFAKPNSH